MSISPNHGCMSEIEDFFCLLTYRLLCVFAVDDD